MDCEENMMAIPSINHYITNLVRNNSNCDNVSTNYNMNYNMNYPINTSNIENCAQNMMHRKGLNLFTM
jgi:hypothetical protein